MGLLSQMETALGSRSRRASQALSTPPKDVGKDVDEQDADTSTLDKDEGNILMALISQRE